MGLSPIKKFYNLNLSPDRSYARKIKRMLGITPGNVTLYRIALTHSSATGDVGSNNERLEFLGDSVLEVITSSYLYDHFPYKGEGELTDLRSKMVSRETLNEIASRIGLQELLEANLPNRVLEASSTLGNALEALLGAVYIDRGMRVARKVVRKVVSVHYDMEEMEERIVNFKSVVIHHAQKNGARVRFRLLEEQGSGGNKIFTMGIFLDEEKLGEGSAPNKKRAEQEAAREACDKLELLD